MQSTKALQTVRHNQTESKIRFLSLYKSKLCNISATCEVCGIGRQTFYDWLRDDPAFDKAVKEIEASIVDWAECKLLDNILWGKEKSLFFFLLNRAPNRWKDKSGNIVVTQTNVNVNKIDPTQMDDKELDSLVRNIVANR